MADSGRIVPTDVSTQTPPKYSNVLRLLNGIVALGLGLELWEGLVVYLWPTIFFVVKLVKMAEDSGIQT